jgi:hypothetical protein
MQRLEIIRVEKILLQGPGITPGFNGVPCLFYSRRTFGQRCLECWDEIKKQTTKSQCSSCYGTGFRFGYHNPQLMYVDFGPSTEDSQIMPFGETEPNEIYVWTTVYPRATKGDLFIDEENGRWRVEKKPRIEMLRQEVRQTLVLYQIPTGDVEFKIPVDKTLFEG